MSTATRVATRFMRRRIAALETKWVDDHKDYIALVWEMYKESYKTIGLHLNGPGDLTKYAKWELILDDEKPVAFHLYKPTPHGLKTGVLGSDGSAVGKAAIKSQLREVYKRPGFFGEVSHGVERLSEGSPVVCAVNVPKVIGKAIVPLEDGVHYKRELENIGLVTKKCVGKPRGVPSSSGTCPIPEKPGEPITPHGGAKEAAQDEADLEAAEHFACQLELEDDV